MFFGDYLDPYSYEALDRFSLVLDFKRAYPDKVTLLLGNHVTEEGEIEDGRSDCWNPPKKSYLVSNFLVEEPMLPLFKPYLDEESALLWLSRYLEGNTVDRKVLYHLNITSNIIQNGTGRPEIFSLFKRLPQEVFGGLSKGGRRNAQASLLLRGGYGTAGKKPESVGAWVSTMVTRATTAVTTTPACGRSPLFRIYA